MKGCLSHGEMSKTGKRPTDKILQFQKDFLDIPPLGTKGSPTLACFCICGMTPMCVSVTIVVFLATTGNSSRPKSRASERSNGAT